MEKVNMIKNTTIDNIYKTIEDIKAENEGHHGSKEQLWIEEHLSNESLRDIVPSLSIIALHILSSLESDDKTGIELSEQLQVTRGGITRAAKKLMQYDLISSLQKQGDRKKIYYHLLDSGKKIAIVHDKMHEQISQRISLYFIEKYSENELKIVDKFIKDVYNFERNFS